MATAILELELERLPERVPVPDGADHALILVRLGGVPVGQALLPAAGGYVAAPAADLGPRLAAQCDDVLWERWAARHLGRVEDERVTDLPSCTVAVCTRDRPDDLARCLDAIGRLDPAPDAVLVVDNAPQGDATMRLVESRKAVRYVREDRPGLDVARNRALREATTDVVAFTDDDAVPDPAWIGALQRNFGEPGVLCVTGLTLPLELVTRAQEAFEEYGGFGRGFRRRVFSAAADNPLISGPMGAGVNMALRRTVTGLVGGFDEALDAGTPTRSGGDHDMFTRILASGYEVVYEPEALVRHRHRQGWAELADTLHGYGVGTYAAWTRALLQDGEMGVLPAAWGWFRHDQLRRVLRAVLGRPGAPPLPLAWAELRGCLAGPWAYLRSRRSRG